MKPAAFLICVLIAANCLGQPLDTSLYNIKFEELPNANDFFTRDPVWRGADGAASVDMKNGKTLWLFSDGFICGDSSRTRKKSKIIRNSIAIQNGYDIKSATLSYHWERSKNKPLAFFHQNKKYWFWTGHGAMIKNKLIVFLMKVRADKSALGFEVFGWAACLIDNPNDKPANWKMTYLEGPDTFGTIAGSAAVLCDENYLYSYGAVEPATHEVYLLRWKLSEAYSGNLKRPEWWLNGTWSQRTTKMPVPAPLFIGGTEYSVHYDTSLRKYIQVQSFGFGEGEIGLRLSDSLQGPWTMPYQFFKPAYSGVKEPFMYSAKAHPELTGNGIYVTYNVNSFNFGELIDNDSIYFPRFVLLRITKKR